MVDAAGAIYVIGGWVAEVWASTDGGARTGLSQGSGTRGVLEVAKVYQGGTQGYSRRKGLLRGTKGTLGAFEGKYPRGTFGVLD